MYSRLYKSSPRHERLGVWSRRVARAANGNKMKTLGLIALVGASMLCISHFISGPDTAQSLPSRRRLPTQRKPKQGYANGNWPKTPGKKIKPTAVNAEHARKKRESEMKTLIKNLSSKIEMSQPVTWGQLKQSETSLVDKMTDVYEKLFALHAPGNVKKLFEDCEDLWKVFTFALGIEPSNSKILEQDFKDKNEAKVMEKTENSIRIVNMNILAQGLNNIGSGFATHFREDAFKALTFKEKNGKQDMDTDFIVYSFTQKSKPDKGYIADTEILRGMRSKLDNQDPTSREYDVTEIIKAWAMLANVNAGSDWETYIKKNPVNFKNIMKKIDGNPAEGENKIKKNGVEENTVVVYDDAKWYEENITDILSASTITIDVAWQDNYPISPNEAKVLKPEKQRDILMMRKDYFPVRFYRVLSMLIRDQPEIITLQELDWFEKFEEILKLYGYEGKFMQKTKSAASNANKSGKPDGCAVFWKTSRILVDKSEISRVPLGDLNWSGFNKKNPEKKIFKDTLKKKEGNPLFPYGGEHYSLKFGNKLLNNKFVKKHNDQFIFPNEAIVDEAKQVAMMVPMTDNNNGKKFNVLTGHFKSGEDMKDFGIKRFHGKYIANIINNEKDPVIFAADFNTDRDDECETHKTFYDSLEEKMNRGYFCACKEATVLSLNVPSQAGDVNWSTRGNSNCTDHKTSYKLRPSGDQLTKIGKPFDKNIDVMYYDKKKFRQTEFLSLPTAEDVRTRSSKMRLPAWFYPSDHLKVGMTLEWI